MHCTQDVVTSPPRAQAVAFLFAAYDVDIDGYLNQYEMRRFAAAMGFDGNDAEWEVEFRKLCDEWGCACTPGVSPALFSKLVDDESDSGCPCTDQELDQLVHEVSSSSIASRERGEKARGRARTRHG